MSDSENKLAVETGENIVAAARMDSQYVATRDVLAYRDKVINRQVNSDLVKEAWAEVLKRYPNDHTGLVWFGTAIGVLTGEVDEEAMTWATNIVETKRSEIA